MQVTIEENKVLSKKLKWISILLIVLATIVVGVSVYVYRQIEPLVALRVKETIRTSTNGLYQISFSRLDINPFTGNVFIKNIVFKPNASVYNRLKKNRINPSHLYEIKVNVLKLKHVHPLKVYLKRDLKITEVQIEEPTVRVYYERTIQKDSSKIDRRTAWQRLSKYLHTINIEKVIFANVDFKYIDRRLKKAEINRIKNLTITLQDIQIDSLSHLDRSRFYNTKNVLVEVLNNEFESQDKMYTIRFDKLEMSSLNSTL